MSLQLSHRSLQAPQPHLKNNLCSKVKCIICTCWSLSSMQREHLSWEIIWPVALHCAVLLLCWQQEMSSPPDECSLYYYTLLSGSLRRSLSVAEPSGEWLRMTTLRGHFPQTAFAQDCQQSSQENPSSLSTKSQSQCSPLCCIQHRGSGWSPVVVSPVDKIFSKKIKNSFLTYGLWFIKCGIWLWVKQISSLFTPIT